MHLLIENVNVYVYVVISNCVDYFTKIFLVSRNEASRHQKASFTTVKDLLAHDFREARDSPSGGSIPG